MKLAGVAGLALSLGLFFGLGARAAQAAPPSDDEVTTSLVAPVPPAPLQLPELTHPSFDVGADWFFGRVEPEGVTDRGAAAMVGHVYAEGSVLVPRRLFLGVSYGFAGALPPDGGLVPGEAARAAGARTLLGNTEAHIRSVFPLPSRLEIGFILGVVAPTAQFERTRANRSASEAAASFDPTNFPQLLPDRTTLRPAGDLRIRRGPFLFQGRHGIDIIFDDLGRESVHIAGRLLAHLGWLITPDLELSLEASQYYFFASEEKPAGTSADAAFTERYRITDGRRSSLTGGPALRVRLGAVDVGAALVVNLSDPLSPAADDVLTAHLSAIWHLF